MAHEAKSREVLELMTLRQKLPARIETFMKKYSLKPAGIGLIVRAAEQNVRGWLMGRALPPGPVVPLMDVLEQSEEARQILGVYRYRSKKSQQRSVKPRRERERQAGLELAAQNKPARKNAPYFDVDLFLEGPVNWPVSNAQVPGRPDAIDPQECDD
jgi:hypothetical protein